MKSSHIKIKLNQNAVKKIALKELVPSASPDDYDGYFYLDEFGDPIFVLETKE